MDKTLNQSQSWKALLPEPWLVVAAARDFSKEAAELFHEGLVSQFTSGQPLPPLLRELLIGHQSRYQDSMLDAYMCGVMEFAKALASGEFKREPWIDSLCLKRDDITGQYGAWFDALPVASVFTPEPAGAAEVDLTRPADPRHLTMDCLERYRKQPCEVYSRALFESLLRWPPMDSWRNFGQVYAIYDEAKKYRSKRGVFNVYMEVLRLMRSKYAGTWNDYHITRWFLNTKDEAQRRAALVELHRRIHLEGPKWAPVSTSAAWAVRSLRDQHPEFDADFRAAVTCEFCLDKLKSPVADPPAA